MIFVSHDRYFLNTIPTKIFELQREGLRIYPGTASLSRACCISSKDLGDRVPEVFAIPPPKGQPIGRSTSHVTRLPSLWTPSETPSPKQAILRNSCPPGKDLIS